MSNKIKELLLSDDHDLMEMDVPNILDAYGQPDFSTEKEWVYLITKKRFYDRRFHIYFMDGKVIDYFIHDYIMGWRVL